MFEAFFSCFHKPQQATVHRSLYYSFARSTRTTLRKGCTQHHRIAIFLQFRANDTHDLTKRFLVQVQNHQITTFLRDRHARYNERVAPSTTRSQFYYNFARSTRTILRKRSSRTGKIVKLLQFRAIDTYDLTKGLLGQVKNRQITTVLRDRHVRSYERVDPRTAKSPNYYSLARSTRTILRKAGISASIFRTMAAPRSYYLSKVLSKVRKLSKKVK